MAVATGVPTSTAAAAAAAAAATTHAATPPPSPVMRRSTSDSTIGATLPVAGSPSLFALLNEQIGWVAPTGVKPVMPVSDFSRERVFAFLYLPFYFESFSLLGVCVCCDAWLFLVTFLPLRLLFMAPRVCLCRSGWSYKDRCDLLRAALLVVCLCLLFSVDTSMCYHWIRGQSTVKLYVLFNMLQVFERCSSEFGADIMDMLFNSVQLDLGTVLRDSVIALVYLLVHCSILFLQVITMQVAINSTQQTLNTLLISSNFVELKSFVSKKNSRLNVFQIACADIVERWQLVVIMLLITVQQSTSSGWDTPTDWFWESLLTTLFVLFAESFIDWIKHGFLINFNRIPPTIFFRFSNVICADLVAPPSASTLDVTQGAARRLGFLALPLVILFLRVMGQILFQLPASFAFKISLVAAVFGVLLILKVVMMAGLLWYASARAERLEDSD